MHPAIRLFPSARFYEGSLADGPGTSASPLAQDLQAHPLFPPLLFLDAPHAAEESRGTSFASPVEAALAVQLALKVRAVARPFALKVGARPFGSRWRCPI